MKLSNSLLQAICIGITAGAMTTACTTSVIGDVTLEDDTNPKKHVVSSSDEGECDDGICVIPGDCPACGLG